MKLEKVLSRKDDWILYDPATLFTKAVCDHEQDAQTIAHRVNCFEELRDALSAFQLAFEGPACCSAQDALGNDAFPQLLRACNQARAALERAKG